MSTEEEMMAIKMAQLEYGEMFAAIGAEYGADEEEGEGGGLHDSYNDSNIGRFLRNESGGEKLDSIRRLEDLTKSTITDSLSADEISIEGLSELSESMQFQKEAAMLACSDSANINTSMSTFNESGIAELPSLKRKSNNTPNNSRGSDRAAAGSRTPMSPGAYSISTHSVTHSVSGFLTPSGGASTKGAAASAGRSTKMSLPSRDERSATQSFNNTMQTTIANLDDMEQDQSTRREESNGRALPPRSLCSVDAESAWLSVDSDTEDEPQQAGEGGAKFVAGKCKRNILIGILILVLVCLAIGLGIGLTTNSSKKAAQTPPEQAGDDGNANATDDADESSFFVPPEFERCSRRIDPNFPLRIVNDGATIDLYKGVADLVVRPLIPDFEEDRFSCSPRNLALWWLIFSQMNSERVHTTEEVVRRYSMAIFLLGLRNNLRVEDSWLSSNLGVCDWAGVSCLGETEIVGFEWNQTLSGSIPEEIALLTDLQSLKLRATGIVSTIPTTIGKLTQLRELDLRYSYLDWVIPSEIGELSNLQILNLEFAALHGQIPTELGRCTSLEILNLALLNLNGDVPSEIGNLSSLTKLLLYANRFANTIPTEVCQIPNISTLVSNCRDCPAECCTHCLEPT